MLSEARFCIQNTNRSYDKLRFLNYERIRSYSFQIMKKSPALLAADISLIQPKKSLLSPHTPDRCGTPVHTEEGRVRSCRAQSFVSRICRAERDAESPDAIKQNKILRLATPGSSSVQNSGS